MWIDYSKEISIRNLNIIFNTDNQQPSIDNKSIIKMDQTHSNTINFISGNKQIYESTDALFTSNNNFALEVKVADCMPIFIFDKKSSFFGVIHAGWRGLANGIIENSINLLKEKDLEIKNIKVFIGPSISQRNFEIQSDVMSYFDSKFSIVKDGKIFLSLQEVVIDIFASYSIFDIININECTYENLNYHSYRRDKTDKRMKGWIYFNE
ncbi:MAG: peptidoglycan editing factor PgeF [Candidatus Marinimicrobia bacterium]|jgi:YfiH family protein|nr:peptidoglycan editing factor PgeF [Candidatus Neomarinimicrobiota bacterium]